MWRVFFSFLIVQRGALGSRNMGVGMFSLDVSVFGVDEAMVCIWRCIISYHISSLWLDMKARLHFLSQARKWAPDQYKYCVESKQTALDKKQTAQIHLNYLAFAEFWSLRNDNVVRRKQASRDDELFSLTYFCV